MNLNDTLQAGAAVFGIASAMIAMATLLGGALSLGPGLEGMKTYERQCGVGARLCVGSLIVAGALMVIEALI